MTDKRETAPSGDDPDLEREIRAGRKFTLSEAIGRMAGGGLMKGESPVAPNRQAELAIEDYLRRHLTHAGGALGSALLRRIVRSPLLLAGSDQPLDILSEYVRQVLGSEYLLQEVVREADAEWGRIFGDRPYFQQEGRPPHPDDPYTFESVRITLSRLIEGLAAGGT